jgi:hypothetical protein
MAGQFSADLFLSNQTGIGKELSKGFGTLATPFV